MSQPIDHALIQRITDVYYAFVGTGIHSGEAAQLTTAYLIAEEPEPIEDPNQYNLYDED